MKLFMYVLPVVFLFILYDMASGLVLYWTVQNILSTAQQMYINWLRKKKDAASGQPVVVIKPAQDRVEAGEIGAFQVQGD